MSNPLQQLFGNMNRNNNGGNRSGFNMNPMQMMQMLMSGQMNPQQLMSQVGGQINQMPVQDYNQQVLQMATQFDNMYGNKQGTLTNILLNSGLSIGELDEAIKLYKQNKNK